MTLRQLKRLVAGEEVYLKNGRISLDGNWFVVEEKVEVIVEGKVDYAFITVDGFENLETALKRLEG